MRNSTFSCSQISDVLKSLLPKDHEELSVLRWVISCAQDARRRLSDVLPASAGNLMAMQSAPASDAPAFYGLAATLPEDAVRYFHGLVEAIEVYRSIHGHPVQVETLAMEDKAVHELRQIRDLCLDDSLHSIY